MRNVSDKRKFLDLEAENTRNVIGLNQELLPFHAAPFPSNFS